MNQPRPSISLIAVSAILLMATSLACGIVAPKPTPNPLVTPSASVRGEGTLIFQSRRDGNAEIYRIQADGTGLVNLTNAPGDDVFAVWSPDGKQIAFNSDRGGQWNLYVMNADGSNPRRLYGLKGAGWPAWSPDSKGIALSAHLIINADGSGERRVTAGNGESCVNPAWSPDGARSAYITWQYGKDEVQVMNADGTDKIRLTYNQIEEDERGTLMNTDFICENLRVSASLKRLVSPSGSYRP
jgi:Tol biopolymer transport system component